MCDSIIGTLLNIPDNTKDGVKSRLNLVEMGICEQLTPGPKGKIRITANMLYFVQKGEDRILSVSYWD